MLTNKNAIWVAIDYCDAGLLLSELDRIAGEVGHGKFVKDFQGLLEFRVMIRNLLKEDE
jgi:hypothetical protein